MDDIKRRQRIVVVGLNYGSILSMVRDLGEAGYDIDVLRVFKRKPNPLNLLGNMKPEKKSKYVGRHEICVMDEDPKRICEALCDMANPERDSLLIAVDDFLVSAIDDYYDILSEHYLISNVEGHKGLNGLMDKNYQKTLAGEFGLPVIESSLISVDDGDIRIPKDTPFPCFIKPNVSTKGSKLIMKRCDSEEELRSELENKVKGGSASILAERFVDIKYEYSILGLSTSDMTLAPCIFRTILPGHRERKGVAITGEILDAADYSDVIDKAEAFVSSTGYVGLFDIDMVEDMEGKIFFTELNLRSGASIRAFTMSGLDLPAMFAESMFKGSTEEPIPLKDISGKKFVSEKALLEEYVRSDISAKTLDENLKKADIFFIKDINDPAPFSYFMKYVRLSHILRIPYKVRDLLLKK